MDTATMAGLMLGGYPLVSLILLLIRVFLAPSIVITAYKQGRSTLVWGIFAVLFPIIAWIVYYLTQSKDICYVNQPCATTKKRK